MADGSLEARLIGDGNVSGSGLPLPDAFTAIAEYLLDNTTATFNELNNVVAHTMRFKTERILALWFSWEDFTRALLTKLADAGLIVPHDGGSFYYLSDDFKSGHHYIVLTQAGIGFTARDEKTRRRMNQDSGLLHALKSALSAHPDANPHAINTVKVATALLTEAIAGPGKPATVRGRRQRRPQDVEKPTARQLAERKYRLNGKTPDSAYSTGRAFNALGLRECLSCKQPKPPEDYERNMYWQGGHNNDWFLRGDCDVCYEKKTAERHGTVNQRRKKQRKEDRDQRKEQVRAALADAVRIGLVNE